MWKLICSTMPFYFTNFHVLWSSWGQILAGFHEFDLPLSFLKLHSQPLPPSLQPFHPPFFCLGKKKLRSCIHEMQQYYSHSCFHISRCPGRKVAQEISFSLMRRMLCSSPYSPPQTQFQRQTPSEKHPCKKCRPRPFLFIWNRSQQNQTKNVPRKFQFLLGELVLMLSINHNI